MRLVAGVLASVVLAGCGGGGSGEGGGSAQAESAATACDTYAKAQLNTKTYQLDKAALAYSMKQEADGTFSLKAPIVVEPGRSTESKQTLECSVRFTDGKDTPDVMKMQFIW
jgi:hypothetical protein